MKKILGLFLAFVFSFSSYANAATDWTLEANVEKVNTIGKTLLSKSNLPADIKFTVVETDEVNAFANADNEICVYTGLLKFVDNDEELAGVIAHEIGHIVNHHVAKQNVIAAITSTIISHLKISDGFKTAANTANNLSLLKMSRTEEYEADITGVDLITNAGCNPLAMVSVLYKISGSYFDFTSTHPSGDKRTMYIYDYITYTYPSQAKAGYTTDSYKKFMQYASPIVAERNSNPSKQASFIKKQEKLKEKRIAKMEKYKKYSKTNGWENSFYLIKSFSNQ